MFICMYKMNIQTLLHIFRSDQIRSVAQLCPTLCDPMNLSTPGLPVHHQLPELTETYVHRVSDAIQPSHPLSSPSPPAPSPSQHQSLFQWCIQIAASRHCTAETTGHVNQSYSNIKEEKALAPSLPLSLSPCILPSLFLLCFSAVIKKKPCDHTRREAVVCKQAWKTALTRIQAAGTLISDFQLRLPEWNINICCSNHPA